MLYQRFLLLSTFAICSSSYAQSEPDLQQQINNLKQQLAALETKLHQQQAKASDEKIETTHTEAKKVKLKSEEQFVPI